MKISNEQGIGHFSVELINGVEIDGEGGGGIFSEINKQGGFG